MILVYWIKFGKSRIGLLMNDLDSLFKIIPVKGSTIKEGTNNGMLNLVIIFSGLTIIFLIFYFGVYHQSLGKTIKTMSLLAGLTLLKFAIDKLQLSFSPEITFVKNEAKPPNINVKDSILKEDSALVLDFGIFPPGQDRLGRDSADSINALISQMPNLPIKEIDIFGGVDIRPLKRLAKKRFGDNITLSQARAVWLKKKIEEIFLNKKVLLILTFPGGAQNYFLQYSEKNHSDNRKATVIIKLANGYKK